MPAECGTVYKSHICDEAGLTVCGKQSHVTIQLRAKKRTTTFFFTVVQELFTSSN